MIEKMHGRKVGRLERRLRVIPYLLMHMLHDAQNRKTYLNLIN